MVCALPAYRALLPSKSKRAQRSYLELLRESEMEDSRRAKLKASRLDKPEARDAVTPLSGTGGNWGDGLDEREEHYGKGLGS